MNVQICVSNPDDELEKFRPSNESLWELVASGKWYQTPYHNGHVAFYIAKSNDGVWLLDRVERNACLDGVTEEDVRAEALNDDQCQAMWGMTLSQAQKQKYSRIVAVCEDAAEDADAKKMANLLYDEVRKKCAKVVGEPDDYGLIDFEEIDPWEVVTQWFHDKSPTEWEYSEFDTMAQLVDSQVELAKEESIQLFREETESYLRDHLIDYRGTFLDDIKYAEDDEEVRCAQRQIDHIDRLMET